jgi:outer membrane immunogenic protein
VILGDFFMHYRLSATLMAIVSTLCLSQVSLAADLRVKAPVYKAPVAAPAYNWTGFYVGASAGYGWSDADLNLVSVGTLVAAPPSFADASARATPPVLGTHPRGFVGGGQFGYNYQINRLVLGYEADFSFADIKGSDTRHGTAFEFSNPNPFEITAVGEQKLDFLGTVRGKLGFTPIDTLLVYATGGLAYGHVESRTNTSDAPAPLSTGPASGSASTMRTGWTAGGGIESALAFAPRWSLKAEYLYYDLGTLSYALSPATVFAGNTTTGTPIGIVNTTATTHLQGNVVRVGLNYRFN